jgi:hypothetical protein
MPVVTSIRSDHETPSRHLQLSRQLADCRIASPSTHTRSSRRLTTSSTVPLGRIPSRRRTCPPRTSHMRGSRGTSLPHAAMSIPGREGGVREVAIAATRASRCLTAPASSCARSPSRGRGFSYQGLRTNDIAFSNDATQTYFCTSDVGRKAAADAERRRSRASRRFKFCCSWHSAWPVS